MICKQESAIRFPHGWDGCAEAGGTVPRRGSMPSVGGSAMWVPSRLVVGLPQLQFQLQFPAVRCRSGEITDTRWSRWNGPERRVPELLMRFGLTVHPGFKSPSLRSTDQ